MHHVTLQDDVAGLPVMPVAFYAGETNMEVPNLAEFSASDDGAGIEAELVDPRWLLTARVNSLGYDDFMVLEGWVQRVRSIHAGRFLGFDPRRRRPRAYDQATPPPAPTLSSGHPRNPPREVALAGFGEGYRLSAGDHVGIISTLGVRSVHRLVGDAVASAGGAVTVSVIPRVLLATASGAPVSLDRPLQLFHMQPGSVEMIMGEQWGEVAFKAVSINRVVAPL